MKKVEELFSRVYNECKEDCAKESVIPKAKLSTSAQESMQEAQSTMLSLLKNKTEE